MNKSITIELTPDEATLLMFQLSRRLDSVTDPGIRRKIQKIVEKVKRHK